MNNEINTGAIAVEETNDIQNFINFLNEVFDNDGNFILSPFIKLPSVGTYKTCKLAGNELNKVRNIFVDKKLPAEFYSALENAGYEFSDGTESDFDYSIVEKNHKTLCLYH